MSDPDEATNTAGTSAFQSLPTASGDASSAANPQGLVPLGPPAGLTAIGPVTQRKIRDWALVLQSMGIAHTARWTLNGWILLVHDEDYARASASIDRYEVENRDWPPRVTRERPRHAPSLVVPLLFASLLVFFLITGPVAANSGWFQRGRAESTLVLSSEPWRAITALTLHADGTHVLGNVISGSIFASAVQRRLGAGGAALAILASGTLGNIANAVMHQMMGGDVHRSIGASTAVFGAIGVLAATQLVLDHRHSEGQKRTFQEIAAPIVGGLSLLGALGASPQSDLGAHLFGFLGGIVSGLFAAVIIRKTRPSTKPWLQIALFVTTLVILFGSWRLALPYRLIWPFR